MQKCIDVTAVLADDGTLTIKTDKLEEVHRVIVEQGLWCKVFYTDNEED